MSEYNANRQLSLELTDKQREQERWLKVLKPGAKLHFDTTGRLTSYTVHPTRYDPTIDALFNPKIPSTPKAGFWRKVWTLIFRH